MNKPFLQVITLILILLITGGCVPANTGAAAPVSAAPQPIATVEETKNVLTLTSTPAEPTLPPPSPTRQEAEEAAVSVPTAPATGPTPTERPRKMEAGYWKEWPVMPAFISEHLREVYQRGLKQGNNPHAFSVLGDCQSQPEVFMGLYDSDPAAVRTLPESLQETVKQFNGSFDRYSPTVKDGTTEGALLWIQWNDNKEKKCEYGETPLDCELRVHKPSIVFIHVGTHYEARNRKYLTTIIDKLLEHGAVPILVTKADNRELDERVNGTLASLAYEYDLPLWNFWASVQHLPENGMLKGSDMYLSDEGVIIHREGALQALDTVWRAVR